MIDFALQMMDFVSQMMNFHRLSDDPEGEACCVGCDFLLIFNA